MIDIHCHILPGMDDGAGDLAESLAMAETASRDGIKVIVATPHVTDRVPSVEVVEAAVSELNAAIAACGLDLTVIKGADVSALLAPSYCRDYAIGSSSYVLIEFPRTHIPRNAKDILFRMQAEGLRPIITHPERNPSVMREPELLEEMLVSGPLAQITAGSLTGEFGPDCRECAEYLLRRGMVSFIASDAHSNTRRRPVLSEALKIAGKIVGMEAARMLVSSNPETIVKGGALRAA